MLFILGTLLLLTGCSDFVDRDQTTLAPERAVILEPGHTVGQTFVARHGGLNGVEFWLEVQPGSVGILRLHLRPEPQSSTDLALAELPLNSITVPGFYRFSFPADNRSHSAYRYAFLELDGTGTVRLGAAPGDAYIDGAAYRDHEPLDTQLAFRLAYNPWGIFADLLLMCVGWAGYGVLGLTALFLAGYWLVRGWALRIKADFTPLLIASVTGILSFWMVFLVWASVFKLRLNAWHVRLLLGIAVLAGLTFFIKDRHLWNRRYWFGKDPLATLSLWLVIICALGLRLWIGRGLVMLPGSDAYHHTLIAQLFAEQGGIPENYEPYAPLQSFSYHFGFHSIVAFVRWLLSSELLSTTKVVALVLNGGIAATAGLFTEQIAGHRRTGVVAAALVGLIMVSPFCLLRWSRFTQTTGLFFLPMALLALLWKKSEADLFFSSLLVAAVFLAHVRVALILGVFAAIVGGIAFLQGRKEHLKQIAAVGAIGAIFVAPWLLRVLWVQYDPYGLRITYPVLAGYNDIRRMEEPVLHFITNWPVLFSILALTVVAIFSTKKTETLGLVLWCIAMVGGALLSSKIGFSLWDLKTTLLSLAIPFAGLAGLGLRGLEEIFNNGWSIIRWLVIVFVLIVATSALIRFPGLIYTGYIYLRPGDLIVMDWIKNNTPPDALFLVNALQFDWQPGWLVGSDAGYWVPLLAHRDSVIPPMVYPMEWRLPLLYQRLEIARLAITGREDTILDLCKVMADYRVTHIFIISRNLTLMPNALPGAECLRTLYHQDRVWIFGMAGQWSR
jgi:hypothetical protein